MSPRTGFSSHAAAQAAESFVGRPVPEVVSAAGTIASCTFLDSGDVDAIAVAIGAPVEGDDELQPRAGTVDASARYGIDLAELAERAAFNGSAGTTHTIDLPTAHAGTAQALPWAGLAQRIIFVGVGQSSTTDLRRAGAALARATTGLARVVSPIAAGASDDDARALIEGYLLASYTPPRLSSAKPARVPADQLVLLGEVPDRVIDVASRHAWATWLVRDLTSTPSNIKTPQWFAERADELAEAEGLEVIIWDEAALARDGFGGILAVGAASASPPRLVTIGYTPFDADVAARASHVVIVGKGITYDTGGLSIKPREAMVPMKTDMAGAAVALAAVLGASQARSPHRVTAVLPLAENHVGADSYRPGDVLTLRGGTRVEIANTDAEGRIVLADALAYADAELAPDLLIDVATLTGAASVGLGRSHAALFSADADLVTAFEEAARGSGERVWQLPLVEDYLPALRSEVADLRHVPIKAAGGGAITAALFLREFTGSRRWVHLDIAGPARSTSAAHEVTKGATGYGARLLLRFIDALA
ncbi:leucyl aminopeptidase [Sanguibacter gelidistatuariae]|uniref:Probable cytosol aminopeptidase n=1 Tax=Sanguibacter gelidistatuariae TaxID=1814289 RepID=A0A1G6MG14_9MICO|nr:leucyl aminopeptidase family protein [Sanguibacter gelidistatuariae]SDC54420.1 leucyl aminopeptidase [Sanguibacter gelidistatuariae]